MGTSVAQELDAKTAKKYIALRKRSDLRYAPLYDAWESGPYEYVCTTDAGEPDVAEAEKAFVGFYRVVKRRNTYEGHRSRVYLRGNKVIIQVVKTPEIEDGAQVKEKVDEYSAA